MEAQLQNEIWTARLLGDPSLQYNGQDVLPLRTQKAKLLLFFFLAEWVYFGRTEHRREFLADLLWPEFSRKAGLENLRQTLYILCQKLQQVAAQPLFTTNRLVIAKASQAQVHTDLQMLKRGHSFDLLQLPCMEHIPL